jgi:hypothetical protein
MHTNTFPEDVITKNSSIEKLQDCFRGELAAVETYTLALSAKSVTAHVGLHRALQELLTSHARRSEQLRESIERLGGEPPTSSGVWGSIAMAVQTGADLLGDHLVIAALEEGEEHGVRLYTDSLGGCDPQTREVVENELLPEQKRTRDLCRTLQEYMGAPT